MKSRLSDEQWRFFEAAFGVAVPGARDRLAKYLELLLVENEKINLTSITGWEEAVLKHLYDSLLVLRGEPRGAVLDWGTGGGTPGIPLAIWTKGSGGPISGLTLLDSVGKKVRAVEFFISKLELNDYVSAVQARGEEFIQKNKIDTVVMRAVAPPERVLGWMSTRVPRWIFLVGPKSLELWESARPMLKKQGFERLIHAKEALPMGLGERHILVFSRSR